MTAAMPLLLTVSARVCPFFSLISQTVAQLGRPVMSPIKKWADVTKSKEAVARPKVRCSDT